MRTKVVFVIVFIISSFSFIFSQTLEEKLLKKREQRIQNYTYQARNGARNSKLQVINSIIEEFDEVKYTEKDKKLVDLAVYLSEEGSGRQEYENNRMINDYPDVRRGACVVLGMVGGDDARTALINVLANDKNSTVKAEALLALGKIKDNSNGEALRAIVYTYRTMYKPDNNFVMAVIQAVREMARSNAASYGDAVIILSEIQMGQYTRVVREEAYKAIKYLNSVEE